MSREIMQQALDLLKSAHVSTALIWERHDCVNALEAELAKPQESYPDWDMLRPYHERIAELEEQLAKHDVTLTDEGKTEQEPLAHAVIAGVLFDFMGWLTSRTKRLVLSASDEASPAVKVIEEFAKMRGLSLDDAKVKDWQHMTAPPKREWVGLTDDDMESLVTQSKSAC